jgi:NAD(P)H dehydrogenase (quinone)
MNRRELLTDAGLATAAVTLFAAGEAQAQAPGAVNVLIAYHSVTGNTEKMAQGVAEGAKGVSSTNVVLKRVGEVTADDLLSADAVVVGSPVYFANMSGEMKTFFDNWLVKFGLYRELKMRNKVGAAFVTGGAISNGKETTMLAIHQAMLMNQMIAVSPGGAIGAFGASATTGPDSPGVDAKALDAARALGKRVAEVSVIAKHGARL